MQTVKQRYNYDCGLAVAAMITGKPMDELAIQLGHDGGKRTVLLENGSPNPHPEQASGISEQEIYKLLAANDYQMGFGFGFMRTLEAPTPEMQGRTLVDFPEFALDLNGSVALLVVASSRFSGLSHYVVWDKICVRDPNPEVPDETKITDYKVQLVYPVNRLVTGQTLNVINHFEF